MHKLPTHKPPNAKAPATDRQARRYLSTSSAQWRAIRRAQLERFPLCEDCGDVANEVDHNTDDTSRNLVGIELSSLCKPCHSRRTWARQNGRGAPRIVGCDVDGWPLDPEHPANVAKDSPVAKKSPEGEGLEYARPASHAAPRIGGG